MTTNRRIRALLAAALVGVLGHAAAAAPFTPGNLALYRIGTGDVTVDVNGTAAGAPVFIDEYTTSGTLVQSIPMPTVDPDGAGPQRRLVAQGSATLEGFLNRSTDGRYLLITGYDAGVGDTPLATSLASDVPRVVGRIAANGTFDISTVIPDLDNGADLSPTESGSPRSAISSNGTDIWVTGAEGGVRYTTFGSTAATTQLNTDLPNLRHIDIFGSQLYTSTMSGSTVRIGTVGTGLPTTSGQTVASLPGVPGAGTPNPDPSEFWMADLSESEPGPDVLYVADARSQANSGGLYKFSLVGGTWVASGSIAGVQTAPATPVSILRGITGSVSGSSVTIYVTRNNGQQLMSVTDSSGQNGTLTGTLATLTTLPNSPARWKFAGIDFVPVDAAPIPGDFNNDRKVDGDDLAVWNTNFGTTMDGEDFLIWQQNYGTGVVAVPAAGAVPEPATALLAGAALLGIVANGRRRLAM